MVKGDAQRQNHSHKIVYFNDRIALLCQWICSSKVCIFGEITFFPERFDPAPTPKLQTNSSLFFHFISITFCFIQNKTHSFCVFWPYYTDRITNRLTQIQRIRHCNYITCTKGWHQITEHNTNSKEIRKIMEKKQNKYEYREWPNIALNVITWHQIHTKLSWQSVKFELQLTQKHGTTKWKFSQLTALPFYWYFELQIVDLL